jgi:NodT family efflux transporter outer membrane factor (OMF) lipoprotein
LLLGCALLTGCAAVGPDFKRPAPPAAARFTADQLPAATTADGSAQNFRVGADVAGAWWTLFQDPALTGLVATALKQNPTLDAARQTLRQARETALAAQGAWFPQLGAGLARQRQELSGAEGGFPGAGQTFSVVTGQLTVNYTFDVWGQTARTVEADNAAAEQQAFALRGAANMLAANTVVAAINTASLRAQLAAEDTLVAAEADLLRTVKRQFELGGATGTDVATQEAQLASTQALEVPLRTQLTQAGDQLSAYLGVAPSAVSLPVLSLEELRLPEDVPVSLPSRLVEQRPDIRASEAQLHAASAQLGVAIANRLPQITLSAFVGTAPATFANVFTPGNGIWSLTNQVTMPLFQGGTLLHQQRAADAALHVAAANYRTTVVAAFQNVADVLTALANDADAVRANDAGAKAAARALELAKIQYGAGGLPYLSVLTTQVQYQNAVLGVIRARAARLSDSAALFAALGGGWWNRNDVPAAPAGLMKVLMP